MKRLLLLMSLFFLYGCPEDGIEQANVEYSCCGENPFESTNIDNLDQSAGEIIVYPFFTPNNDGVYDVWQISNLNLYSNVSLEVFNLNDVLIYTFTEFNQSSWWDGSNAEDGIYKYKLVIENEQTYIQQGVFCRITTEVDDLPTDGCDTYLDPIIN